MGAPQAAPQPTYTANRPPAPGGAAPPQPGSYGQVAPGGAAPPQPGSYGQVAAGVQQKLAQQYGGTAPETGTAGRTKEQIQAEGAAKPAGRRRPAPVRPGVDLGADLVEEDPRKREGYRAWAAQSGLGPDAADALERELVSRKRFGGRGKPSELAQAYERFSTQQEAKLQESVRADQKKAVAAGMERRAQEKERRRAIELQAAGLYR
jgi:hypothetical protein